MKFGVNSQLSTYIFATCMLLIIGVLIVPLPPPLLDVLFAIDLLLAGIVMITSIVIREPIEFAAFAPILLIGTLFRLSLDVSATRLILSQANIPGGVGTLIPAFGEFVIHGNLVVGIIIFAILTTIQFVVIAAGAGRVSEVAARFALDALPGKQMAIDAELHAGAIDSATAKARRRRVQREADFFGAMDGAGKFVKGDAIAALVIVVLNLIGGIVIGMGQHGLSINDALGTYARDSIGNALLTTLPSFLLSTTMGLLVTRVTADGVLGADLHAQIFGRPIVLRIAGGFALALGCIPALPHIIFLALGLASFGGAHIAAKQVQERESKARLEHEKQQRGGLRRPEVALARVGVDPLTLSFGRGVLGICVGDLGEAFLDRIAEVRRVLATELGVILPGVRLRDGLELPAQEYTIAVRGEVVARGRLDLEKLLVIADVAILAQLPGDDCQDPVYGLAARQVMPDQRERAQALGGLVFDPVSIVTSHLSEITRSHAAQLLGRQELQTLIDHLKSTVPAVIKEITGERVGIGVVLRVFHGLLEERVWPRDTIAVFEAIIDAVSGGADDRAIISYLRNRFVPAQVRRSGMMKLTPLLLDPTVEALLRDAWQSPQGAAQADPRLLGRIRSEVERYGKVAIRSQAAIMCTAGIRPELARFIRRLTMEIPVFAFSEIPSDVELQPFSVIGPDTAPAAVANGPMAVATAAG